MEVLVEPVVAKQNRPRELIVPLNSSSNRAKRAVDVFASLLGMLIGLPLALLLAMPIWLQSRGSVMFIQTRVGLNGRPFRMFKFRSMYADADIRLGRLLLEHPDLRIQYETFHKLTDDPRVTPIGRFMRRFSLDELPQLWNVLVGNMSLVGPRPYLAHELCKMGQAAGPILSVRPGLTGLWQVSGRNLLPFHQRIELDYRYVRTQSLKSDLAILAKTIPVVSSAVGAV
jgi:lipopolysaccharide/colanic/teichoic acid biosynthesis glycosyltransferase